MVLTDRKIENFKYASSTFIDHPGYAFESDSKNYVSALVSLLHELGPKFCLDDAKAMCELGFFVTHERFSNNESMHCFNHHYYYEDGADLTVSGLLHTAPDWMNDGWYVKAAPHEIDYRKLSKMHKKSKGSMLCGKSYEDCLLLKGRKHGEQYYQCEVCEEV